MKKVNHLHLLHKLAEKANYVIFIFDMEAHQFLYLNPFFEQLWQQKRDTVMEDPASLLETIHPDDKEYVIKTYQQLSSGEKEQNIDIEFQIQLSDESIHWLHLTSSLHEEPSGQRIVSGLIEDVSSWREEQEVLKKQTAKKDAVLQILSHDLARPMATIEGLSTMMIEHLKTQEDEQLHELIEMIESTCRQGIRLIHDFVEQEFLESAQVDLIKQRVEIVHELREVIKQYQNSEKDIDQNFYFFTNSDTIYLEIDEIKFMQVITNLLSNAIKFTPDGGEITLGVEEQENHVLITVEDNGIGIPSDLQQGLFEKFPKARRPGLKGEPSTGLGMSIIKTIVDWHGGKIWLESEENKGTSFFIQLPKQ